MSKTLTKQLATMEDLASGVGQVTQDRNGTEYVLGKIATPYAVKTQAELQALDTNLFQFARVIANKMWTDYEYDATDGTGVKPITGIGSWIQIDHSLDTLTQIARSFNVLDSQVIHSTDTVTVLDGVLYIYDSGSQVTWGVPTLNGPGETITSVVGSALETTGGSYTLTSITPTTQEITSSSYSKQFAATSDLIAGLSKYGQVQLSEGDEVTTSGFTSIGDGGGTSYLIKTTGVSNPFTLFDIGNGLFAHLNESGVVTSKQCGAVADYDPILNTGTDDTLAIEAFRDYCLSVGATVQFSKGNHLSGHVEFNDLIIGGKGAKIYKRTDTLNSGFIKVTNCEVYAIEINNNLANMVGYPLSNNPQLGSCLIPNHSTIKRVTIPESESSCIAAATVTDNSIEDCYLTGWVDHAIYWSTDSRRCHAKNIKLGAHSVDAVGGNAVLQVRSGGSDISFTNIYPDNKANQYFSPFLFSNNTVNAGDMENISIDGYRGNFTTQFYIDSEYADAEVINTTLRKCHFVGNGTGKVYSAQHRAVVNINGIDIENCSFKGYTGLTLNGSFGQPLLRNVSIKDTVIEMTGPVSIGSCDKLSIRGGLIKLTATATQVMKFNSSPKQVVIDGVGLEGVDENTAAFGFANNTLTGVREVIYLTNNQLTSLGATYLAPTPGGVVYGQVVATDNTETQAVLTSDSIDAGYASSFTLTRRIRQTLGDPTITVIDGIV